MTTRKHVHAPAAMSSLTLQFVGGKGWQAGLIKWFGGSGLKVSHVDAVLPDGRLFGARSDAVGGAPPGCNARPPDYEPWDPVIRATIPAPKVVVDRFYGFLLEQRDKPYDRLAIFAFFVDRNWREEGAYICSELQALALERSGLFKHPIIARASKITPADLLLLVSPVAEVSYVATKDASP